MEQAPLNHYTQVQGSQTAIQNHGSPQVVGMSYHIIPEDKVQRPPFNIMAHLKLWWVWDYEYLVLKVNFKNTQIIERQRTLCPI